MTIPLDGTWQGVMQDIEGFTARTTLSVEGSSGEVKGKFTYRLAGCHEPGKELSGTVQGKSSQEGLVTLVADLEGLGKVTFEGRSFPVKHHAKAAVCGIYHVAGDSKREPLGGGTAVFWKYEEKK